MSGKSEPSAVESNPGLRLRNPIFADVSGALESAEAALRESQLFLGLSLDALADHVAILDEFGAILIVNEAWRRFGDENQLGDTGYGVGSNYIHACEQMFADDGDGLAVATGIREVLAGKRDRFEREYPCHSPTEQRWFFMRALRLKLSGPVRILVAHDDITEKKRLADERDRLLSAERTARAEAETANLAKDRFLAALSHELRTPLTPVVMMAAAHEMNLNLPPEVRADMKMIRLNVELETRLIDDLLDLNRIVSGKLRLDFDRLDINGLLRHVCDMCLSNLNQKGITLHCDLDESAGDVVGDSSRLHQVFWNLLNNATKFTPEGGDVYVTTENLDSGDVRVTVRDTGIGIPPQVLPRIFDAFEQGDIRITRKFGGLGLGLSIAKLLVDQHRGSIRAHTKGLNQGSTFIVELPALPSEPAVPMSMDSPRADVGKAEPLRLLLVDDHADTVRVLSRLLTASGHLVTTAVTATAALTLAAEHVFDLVLSDLGLPDMTGYELMKQLKERHGIRGIAMSGYGMEEDIRKSEQAGFSEHIIKPVNLERLELSIHRVAGKGELIEKKFVGPHGE